MSLPPAAASALSSFFASLSIGLQAARPKASDAASRLAVAKRSGDVMSGQLRLCVGCRPRAGNGGMRGLKSEDVEKFDIEDQRRVRLDRRISLLAVGQLTGNPEPVFGADGHHRHAFGPARDHLVQAELGGAAMPFGTNSAERRVGQEWVSTCRFRRWACT